MSYLVDTCVVSEPTKPRPAHGVVAWLRSADPESLFLSVLTLGEIEKGIERLATSKRRRELRRWFDHVRAEAVDRIIGIDAAIATEWGRLLARSETRGHPLPAIDALIGATAIVRGLTVVTRNSSDIRRTGAPILDPWAGS